jgi:hypothetical protein
VCWTAPSTPHSPGCSQQAQTGTYCCGATEGTAAGSSIQCVWLSVWCNDDRMKDASLHIQLAACAVWLLPTTQSLAGSVLVQTGTCCCGATDRLQSADSGSQCVSLFVCCKDGGRATLQLQLWALTCSLFSVVDAVLSRQLSCRLACNVIGKSCDDCRCQRLCRCI